MHAGVAGAGYSPEAHFRQTQVEGMGGKRACSETTGHEPACSASEGYEPEKGLTTSTKNARPASGSRTTGYEPCSTGDSPMTDGGGGVGGKRKAHPSGDAQGKARPANGASAQGGASREVQAGARQNTVKIPAIEDTLQRVLAVLLDFLASSDGARLFVVCRSRRSLSGRLKLTVRRHTFNKDSLSVQGVAAGAGSAGLLQQVFKLPWREAGPPNHHDDRVDSDQ